VCCASTGADRPECGVCADPERKAKASLCFYRIERRGWSLQGCRGLGRGRNERGFRGCSASPCVAHSQATVKTASSHEHSAEAGPYGRLRVISRYGYRSNKRTQGGIQT
jgi:hypothetical protein